MSATISSPITLADQLFPLKKSADAGLLRDTILVISFSIFLALCAQVSFNIPNTTVPVTLQTLAVLLTGATLGSRRGALAVLAYLAEGAAGMPVFAGTTGGLIHLIGPTAGYLWAFPIATYVTGVLCEKGLDRNIKTSALAMLPGSLIIYLIGVPWLACILHLSLPKAINAGMLPFLGGDLLKLIIAAALLPTTWTLTGTKKTSHKK